NLDRGSVGAGGASGLSAGTRRRGVLDRICTWSRLSEGGTCTQDEDRAAGEKKLFHPYSLFLSRRCGGSPSRDCVSRSRTIAAGPTVRSGSMRYTPPLKSNPCAILLFAKRRFADRPKRALFALN